MKDVYLGVALSYQSPHLPVCSWHATYYVMSNMKLVASNKMFGFTRGINLLKVNLFWEDFSETTLGVYATQFIPIVVLYIKYT